MTDKKRLGINIDHVATVRQARGTSYPDPLYAAQLAAQAGADNITLHLREDRRHIQDNDVKQLQQVVSIPMNLEMAITNEMLSIAEQVKPHSCCLVPEKRHELTTEGGLDVLAQQQLVTSACQRLSQAGILVSIFIDPEPQQIKAAQACGAPAIEIHTGTYADASGSVQQQALSAIQDAAALAADLGLQVHAGHGLHYENVQAILAVPQISELNIGHAIVARALFVGFAQAVKEMKKFFVA